MPLSAVRRATLVPPGTSGNRQVRSSSRSEQSLRSSPIETHSVGNIRQPDGLAMIQIGGVTYEKRPYFSRYRRRYFAFIGGQCGTALGWPFGPAAKRHRECSNG